MYFSDCVTCICLILYFCCCCFSQILARHNLDLCSSCTNNPSTTAKHRRRSGFENTIELCIRFSAKLTIALIFQFCLLVICFATFKVLRLHKCVAALHVFLCIIYLNIRRSNIRKTDLFQFCQLVISFARSLLTFKALCLHGLVSGTICIIYNSTNSETFYKQD